MPDLRQTEKWVLQVARSLHWKTAYELRLLIQDSLSRDPTHHQVKEAMLALNYMGYLNAQVRVLDGDLTAIEVRLTESGVEAQRNQKRSKGPAAVIPIASLRFRKNSQTGTSQ